MALVGVTGFHSTDNPSPGLAIARCLLEAGHQVIALDYSPFSTGLHFDGIKHVVMLEKFDGNSETYISNFVRAATKVHVQVVIPSIDMEVRLLSQHLNEFEIHGIKVLVPSVNALERSNKRSLGSLASDYNFNYPKTFVCVNLEDVKQSCNEIGFPCYLKSSVYEGDRVSKPDDIPYYVERLITLWDWPILVQEAVEGEELGVAALCGFDGKVVGSVQMKKIGITDRGKTWAGVTIRDERISELVNRILGAIKWVGGCELEFIRTPENKLFLLEINPRFPAWIFLTHLAHCNLPALAVDLLQNQHTGSAATDYHTGVAFARIATEVEIHLSKTMQLQLEGEWQK